MTDRINSVLSVGAEWCGGLGRAAVCGLSVCSSCLLLWVAHRLLLEPARATWRRQQQRAEQLQQVRGEREVLQERLRAMKAGSAPVIPPLAPRPAGELFSEEWLIRTITSEAHQAGVAVEGIARSQQLREGAYLAVRLSARASFDALQLFVSRLHDIAGSVYLDGMMISNQAWPRYSGELEMQVTVSGESNR